MGTNMQIVKDFKQTMTKELEMIDLEPMRFFLVFKLRKSKEELFLLSIQKIC